MSDTLKRVIFASSLPLALGATAGRWGHQAVYVPSQQTMYVVGGQVVSSGSKVTNDVLVLPLNTTGATFSAGPSDALPPHAFAAATLSQDGESLIVLGGMTSSCSSDALTHTLSLADSSATWEHASPTSFVRRRGAAAAWVDDGSTHGEVLVIGGVADTYSCSSGTYTYPATDVLSVPLGSSALKSTSSLPASLTGSQLAVSDFAFTRGTDGSLYLVGGQSASGDLVSLSTVGKWTTSQGWVSQATAGDVPAGRVGASLVAHPSLDLLILHGGSVNSAATSTLAFLNTTSWTWSTPQSLQPPASNAASYHTSVVTPQGVMITAFGLGASGSPSSNVFYLDMRAPSQAAWKWKSYWDKDMLDAYSASSGTTSAINTASTISSDAAAAQAGSGSGDKKKVTSIVVPVLIAALILLPLAIWFARRKIRLAKKRRMARHFSFETQEDEGEFRAPIDTFNAPSRRTKTQYGFGKDANEREGNVLTDLAGAFKRLSRGRRSVDSTSTTGEREMTQVAGNTRVSRLDERTMRWEEIDFGLGKLDERAQTGAQASSVSAPAGVASTIDPFADPAPLIRFDSIESEGSNHMGTPLHDGQQPLVPEVTVQPPTVPPTPMSGVSGPAFQPSAQDGLDWNLLAQEMQVRPAFRSISPTSTLRSHAHSVPPTTAAPRPTVAAADSRSATPTPISPFDDPPSSLPYVEDGYTPAPAVSRLPLADAQRSSGPPRLPSLDFSRMSTFEPLRPSAPLPPRTSSHGLAPSGSRAVSQPVVHGRQLAGSSVSRRDSTPDSSTSSGSTTPTPRSPDFSARRASNPAVLTRSPASPVLAGPRGQGSPNPRDKRDSAMTKLRVVNLTEEDESTEEGR